MRAYLASRMAASLQSTCCAQRITHTHTHTHTHTLHGQVNFLCTHKDIKAVSFVGSGTVGRIVYDLSCAHGKRVQCNMGAKNHAVIMPDAQVPICHGCAGRYMS